jgi:hypothetical protein
MILQEDVMPKAQGKALERVPERRRFRRYAVSFPCLVKTLSKRKGQSSLELETETRDMSKGGFFFVVPAGRKLPDKIECLVRLPIKTPAGKTVAIRCRGKVVRTTHQDSGSLGVAASIEQFEFTHLA